MLFDALAALGFAALILIAWVGARRQKVRQDAWDAALVKLWEQGE